MERQKRRRLRVSVFLDGAFAFGVNEEAVLRFGLRKGMELSEELRRDIEDCDLRVQAKLFAERHIAARMRSERELRQYLKKKEIPEEIIDETIATFIRVQLLNDEEFARAWVRDRMRMKPKSGFLLRRELSAKGIKREVIDRVLGEEAQEDETMVIQLAHDWLRRHSSLDAIAAKRRLAGFLQRRGFSASAVYGALEEVMGRLTIYD